MFPFQLLSAPCVPSATESSLDLVKPVKVSVDVNVKSLVFCLYLNIFCLQI